jgi:hypothetical protein
MLPHVAPLAAPLTDHAWDRPVVPSARRWRICEGLRLAGVIPAGAQVQVHPAALPLHLIDLALAVSPGRVEGATGPPRAAMGSLRSRSPTSG